MNPIFLQRSFAELLILKWDKIFKSGLSKFCGRQTLKNLLNSFLNTLSQIFLKSKKIPCIKLRLISLLYTVYQLAIPSVGCWRILFTAPQKISPRLAFDAISVPSSFLRCNIWIFPRTVLCNICTYDSGKLS